MRHTLFHTVLLMLLVLLYAADCGMPCIDGCGLDPRDVPSAVVTASAHGDHDHRSAPAEAHCECHCICACHLPLIAPSASAATQPQADGIRGPAYLLAIPIPPVNPPDHIPLV